jgi:hypothetical protein
MILATIFHFVTAKLATDQLLIAVPKFVENARATAGLEQIVTHDASRGRLRWPSACPKKPSC